MSPEFETVIGLEVHAQLSTHSKIFCACPAKLSEGRSVADEIPNINTCPVCAGHPGTLPVLNQQVVAFAIRAGLATHCKIQKKSIFARKNYFYPDLPKGYQISQYDQPICTEGWLNITAGNSSRKITIQRIHLEEDAGKNVHMSGYSLVNLNRAGVPLIEIVTAPDMRTAEEAGAYLRALHAIVTYIGVCDGNMQEGNFRCDANVSVRPKGSDKLGTRTEIKNVNSFRFVEKAIEYEAARQISVIQSGGKIVQETRLYDSAKNITVSMRSKEDAHDYRYFPDPDLLPILVDEQWVEKIQSELPELPEQKQTQYIQKLELSQSDAAILTSSKAMADFFESTLALWDAGKSDYKALAKTAANLLSGEILRLLNDDHIEIHQSKITQKHLADLSYAFQSKVISSTGAKQVLAKIWKSSQTPSNDSVEAIIEKEGLKQVSDTSALEPIIDEVLAKNPGQVQEFKSGKDKLIGFFVGQVMKLSGGKANPALVQDLILKKLKG